MSLRPPAAGLVPHAFATRSVVMGRAGMVCASQPLATQVGLAVLAAGGTAVDAAIATNAILGLTEPCSCGVGGDLFALGWDPETRRLYGLNGSGRSPAAQSADDVRAAVAARGERAIPERDPLAVSVPGAVEGWFELHERYGRLPMAQLLEPAIVLASEGFPVTRVIAAAWARAERTYAGCEAFGRTYLPQGRAPREGELFRNAGLARTYEHIAGAGRDAFRDGEVAHAIVDCMRAAGRPWELDDLRSQRAQWVEPVSVSYRGHEVWELPPNGQGLAALQMLAVLSGFDIEASGLLTADTLHLMIEAKKLAYEDRARLYADPDFAQAPVEALLSEAYAAERRALIDPRRAASAYPPGDFATVPGSSRGGVSPSGIERLQNGDTVYFTVADRSGHVVSWIQSNYMGFGSGVVPEGWGFGLQNRGCSFALDPLHANAYAPGKRPFHTIIPGMITRAGVPVTSFGVMGGDMQPQGHVQVVSHLLDFGLDVQAAGDVPRWRHMGSSDPAGVAVMAHGGRVYLEPGVPRETAAELSRRGHVLLDEAQDVGGYQGIVIDRLDDAGQRVYRGGSESRKDGAAVGI